VNHETVWLMQDLEGWVSHFLQDLPWAKNLEKAEQIELIRDLLQAVRDHDQALMETLLQEWQATAETLANPAFMQAYQRPNDPQTDVPWEQVRDELDLPRNPEAGRP
jgi:hypothetical protein